MTMKMTTHERIQPDHAVSFQAAVFYTRRQRRIDRAIVKRFRSIGVASVSLTEADILATLDALFPEQG